MMSKSLTNRSELLFRLCQDAPAGLARTAVAVSVSHATLVQDSRNNKKRKAHTLNGYTSSQGHLQAAAAVATQQDEQPECSTAPRSAGPGWEFMQPAY